MKVKLGPIQQRLSLLQHMKSQDGLVMSVSSNSVDHHEMSVEEIDEEIETLSKQKKEINGKLFEIESRRGSTISPEDITVLLQQCFHYNPADGEVERMIFEVDETMDGRVNWDDFQLTYMRNINDKTGLEPYGLHNVISFGMHQAEGKITVGEAKHLLKKCRNYTETQINETVVRVVKLPPSGEEQHRTEQDQHSKPVLHDDQQITFGQYKQMASKRYTKLTEFKPDHDDGGKLVSVEVSKELTLPYLRKKGKGLSGVPSIYAVTEVVPEPIRKAFH